MSQRMLTLAWEGVWWQPHQAAEQVAVRRSMGVPVTTGGISGNEAIVRWWQLPRSRGFFMLSGDSARLQSCVPSLGWF